MTNGQDNVFAVSYEYDNGYLKEISGLDNAGQKCITHWQADKYDALGRTEEDILGKIVKTTRDYDPAQGVLLSIQSVLQQGSGAMVQNLSYMYDDNNNVSSREDHTSSVFEAFTYDHLDRLKTHTRTLNGAQSQVSVTYDALGNIRSKSDVGNYKYADPSKPYTLTSVESGVSPSSVPALDKFEVDWDWGDQQAITQAQANIHDSTYEYDANGSIEKQGDRRVYWTAFDKPHTMVRVAANGTQRGSTIDYNADFERNFKQERTFSAFGIPNDIGVNKQTTYYVGKDYEKIVETDGTIKHRYTISTGGGTIQIERLDGSLKDQPKYILADNLGSSNVILNALGEVEQRLEFDPWGMRVAGPDVGVVNSITNKGYTGHEMDDEVGLINMNARIYDPYLGRFLSADPVLPDAFDMQSFNRYSYVRNNPLKYIDPTGNKDEPVDGGSGQKPLEQVTVTEAAISPPLANGARKDDFIDVGGSRGESLYRLDGVIYNEEDLLARLVELRDEHNQNRLDQAIEDANDPHAGASRIATARRDQARGDYSRLRASALDRFLNDFLSGILNSIVPTVEGAERPDLDSLGLSIDSKPETILAALLSLEVGTTLKGRDFTSIDPNLKHIKKLSRTTNGIEIRIGRFKAAAFNLASGYVKISSKMNIDITRVTNSNGQTLFHLESRQISRLNFAEERVNLSIFVTNRGYLESVNGNKIQLFE